MGKSTVITIIVAVILVGAGAALLTHKSHTKTSTSPASSTAPATSTTPNTGSTNSSTSQSAATGHIEITNNMIFTPSQISVKKGDTVTWTNNDDTAHTVTDDLTDVGGPASGDIAPGATYSFSFTKTGSFQYHCEFHHQMRGTVVVK